MQCMLNFSLEEKGKVLSFLRQFPAVPTKTGFEQFRCRIGESTVTLYSSGKLLVQGKDCSAVKERILRAVQLESELVIGIDESGRGEPFGSLVVAAVLADSSKMRELRDSKKVRNLQEKRQLVEKNAIAIETVAVSAAEIDELRAGGVNLDEIEARAINALVEKLAPKGKGARVLVDGKRLKGVKAGIGFIVKGDDRNAVIGAASVIAKSERERNGKGRRSSWGKRK